MRHLQMMIQVIQRKRPLSDVWYYIQGHLRYYTYYNGPKFFMRKHIREQIDFRISIMNPTCYYQGSCIHCGCDTTMLQMANKQCDGKEYPRMMNKKAWNNGKDMIKEAFRTVREKAALSIFLEDQTKQDDRRN